MPTTTTTSDYTAMRQRIDDYDLLYQTVAADVALSRRSNGRRYVGLCPFHSERTPSFYLFTPQSNKGQGFKCYGCGAAGHNAVDYVMQRQGNDPHAGGVGFTQALRFLGLDDAPERPALPPKVAPLADGKGRRDRRSWPNRAPDVVFPYVHPEQGLVYEVCRWNLVGSEQAEFGGSKTFAQRRVAPDGRRVWGGVPEEERLLYRLPDLLADLVAHPDEPVFITEGEGKTDALRAAGLLATSATGGASQWPDHWSHVLAGRIVVLTPDNDARGYEHTDALIDALSGIAGAIKVLPLPQLWPACPPKGDVKDLLLTGWPAAALRACALLAQPLPDGAAPLPDPAMAARLAQLEQWQRDTDALMAQGSLDTSERVGIYLLSRFLEARGIEPGDTFDTTQKELAALWEVSTDTIKRWLVKWEAMKIASHHVVDRPEPRRKRDGSLLRDRESGKPVIKHNKRTVVALHARPREVTITLESPPGPTGATHGGKRTPGCPSCGAPVGKSRGLRHCACGCVYDKLGSDLGTLDPPPTDATIAAEAAEEAAAPALTYTVGDVAPLPPGAPPPPASECEECGSPVYLAVPLNTGHYRYIWVSICRTQWRN